MRVEVTRAPRPNVTQSIEVPSGATVGDVLRHLCIPPDAVLVVLGDEPVPLDLPVGEGERLRVVTVFSGG